MKLSEIKIKLGGHKAVITGGDVELDTGGIDTLAGALWVEDKANAAVFGELSHVEEVDGKEYAVTYGVNAEKTLVEKEESPKAVAAKAEPKAEKPKAKAKK